MASPRRIVRLYAALSASAADIQSSLAASGGASKTVTLLIEKDPVRLLTRWGEEMVELCGVLDGSHNDSYLMEATQTFYWASLYAAVRASPWEELQFDQVRRLAATCGVGTVPELRTAIARLVALGATAKPTKLFLLWCVAERMYRVMTPPDKQWSLEQLMEADLQDMKKKPYFQPLLAQITEE
jgi:hypothetical protein